MFNKQSIDTDILVRISLLLKENFVKQIYQLVEDNLRSVNTKDSKQDSCEENKNKVLHKLELIHQDLMGIKNILVEIKEVKL